MAKFIEVTAAHDNPDPYYEKMLLNLGSIRSIMPIGEAVRRKAMSKANTRINYEGFGVVDVCEDYEMIRQMIMGAEK